MNTSNIEKRLEPSWLTSGAIAAWRRERVWLLSLTILAALFVWIPAQGMATAIFTLGNVAGIAPYLLLSIGLAAYAGATGADSLIARAFTGSPPK